MIYNLLRNRLGIVIGILLQAVLFGFLHTFGIVHAVFATLLGIGLAFAYELRGTLLSPIFIHTFQNTTAVVATAVMMAVSPMLGISGVRHPDGCQLTRVAPASAAEEAGLLIGDVVTKIDGRSIADITEIVSIVRQKKVGEQLDIEFRRDGETFFSSAVLKSQFLARQ